MPLTLLRSHSSDTLWSAFTEAFLEENGTHSGPGDFPAFAWLTHRIQRDALYQAAAARGVRAWLGPPMAFFSELPRLFDIRERPVGLLRRQSALDDLAMRLAEGERHVHATSYDRRGVGRAHDHLIGDLLAEGVTPDALEEKLAALDGDDFSRRRNRWIVAVYRGYLDWLAGEGRYDPREIHAMVAEHVEQGGLGAALRGATRLHVYGLTTLRTRRRLIQALGAQPDVHVMLYAPAGPDTDEWLEMTSDVRELDAARTVPTVQPAPDERRELDWVAVQIKKLLAYGEVAAERVAIVARSGREDARATHETLSAAGIPATARLRSALDEVPALKAVLLLLRAAARDWPYRLLRQVLASPYFDMSIDLRALDRLAAERRITSLGAWGDALTAVVREADAESPRAVRLRQDVDRFQSFARQVGPLSAPRAVRHWLAVTRELLDPGWLDFRHRVCQIADATSSRLDVVRLDQQGIGALDRLLAEWYETEPEGEPIDPGEWVAGLRRFLANNEVALTTPLRTGVQILEAHEAALFPFAHAFVIHANDGEFPKRPGTSWLFTDGELTALRDAGLPLADRAAALRRERVLWRSVTGGRNVTVTYRTADPDGRPLLPSLMVPAHDPSTEIPRTQFVWNDPVTPAHADRLAAQRLLDAKRQDPRALVRVPRVAPVQRAVLAAVAELQRRSMNESAWSGRVRDEAALALIATWFGPDAKWSPSRLEQYAQNPFVFFVKSLLKLEEVVEAEEDPTPLSSGSVVHALLERFYAEYDGPYPGALSGTTRDLYDRVADRVLAEQETQGEWLGLPLLWLATRRRLRQMVADFLEWDLAKLDGRRPHLLEYDFGSDEPLWVEGADVSGTRVRMRLRGRIDRVEVDEQGLLHVVDYKSGGTPQPKEYEDGGAQQGPLYLYALAQANSMVATAAYLSVRNRTRAAAVAWRDDDVQRALRIAFSIPARIRAGHFEPIAAASKTWVPWWPGIDICRVRHEMPAGECRFDG